jgi:hypothetical protein
MADITVAYEEPQWNSGAAWKLPGWAEPVVSISFMNFFGIC